MHLVRHADAVQYDAPFHTNVDTRRIQGLDAGPSDAFWVGISVYPPGGIAGPSEVAAETVYVVLDGEFTLECEGTHTVRKHDSIRFVKGEHRTLSNTSDADATLLVCIAKPQA